MTSALNQQPDMMMISSNASKGILRVRYTRASKGKLELALMNYQGNVLDAPVRLVSSDSGDVEFAITHDQPGMYFVQLKDGKAQFMQRVNLQ